MKKIIAITLILSMALSTVTLAATKEYDHSGDIPEGDVAEFYAYPIHQRATRYAPWFIQWGRQSKAEAETGIRAGDGNQMVMALETSPLNPDYILMGTDKAGIWRSTDGGINWDTTGGNNNNWCVNDFEWSPYEEDVVFSVQTGTRIMSSNIAKTGNSDLDGLYKSNDAGKTWNLVLEAPYISMATSNDLVLYDKNGDLITLTSKGLYTSKNGGDSWEFLDNSVIPADAGVFAMHLFDGNIKKIMIGIEGGLFYTNNGGLIWQDLTPDIEGITMCTSVTVDPFDENHWFACFQGPEKILYQTTDAGKTWTPVNYRKNNSGSKPFVIRYALKPDGTTRLIMVYSTSGTPVRYSDDNGETWQDPKLVDGKDRYNNTTSGYYTEGISINHKTPGVVFYSFGDTIYKSTDGGTTFYYRNAGYSAINTCSMSFDQEGRILFGDVDRGLAITDEPYKKGEYSTVTRLIKQIHCTATAVDPDDVNHILAFAGGLQESFDRGLTWTQSELFSGTSYVLQYHNKDKKFVYAKDKYSTDKGKTWKSLPYELKAVSPANNDVIYALDGSKIKQSKDRGKTWNDFGVTSGSVYSFIADVSDEDTVWYGTYSGTVTKVESGVATTFGKENGLYTDKGKFVSLNYIAQNPNNPKHLITGGKETACGVKSPGIFETLDGGKTWELVPGMKGILDLTSITFSPFSDEVFIGTCSNGLIIYDYNIFHDWYNGKLTSWDKSDEYIIPNMYKDGRIRVKIDSDVIGFDSQPFLENDRTFVPMRKIFEKLGATIEWDDATQTVTGTKDKTVVKLTIGSEIATINGVEKTLDAVPQLRNDRTMIPLRFVAEALGCKVDWSDSNNLVIIKSK